MDMSEAGPKPIPGAVWKPPRPVSASWAWEIKTIIMIPVFILFYSLILFVTLAVLFRRIGVFRYFLTSYLSFQVVLVYVSFTVNLSWGCLVLVASCLLQSPLTARVVTSRLGRVCLFLCPGDDVARPDRLHSACEGE